VPALNYVTQFSPGRIKHKVEPWLRSDSDSGCLTGTDTAHVLLMDSANTLNTPAAGLDELARGWRRAEALLQLRAAATVCPECEGKGFTDITISGPTGSPLTVERLNCSSCATTHGDGNLNNA